jgi:hypothetical protein
VIFEDDDDPDRARRQWNAYLDAIDAEIADECRQRSKCETDLGKVLQDAPLGPFIYDAGPLYTSPADERAIQANEDRITRLDRRDRGR